MEELSLAQRRYRTSLKFTLWTWALYWFGGGMMLISSMRDPVSLIIMALSGLSLVLLMLFGGLNIKDSHNMKEFLLERPIYLIAGFIVVAILAPIFTGLQNTALAIFAAFFLLSLGLQFARAIQLTRDQGGNPILARTDQVVIVLALSMFCSLLIFIDGMAQAMDMGGVGNSASSGAFVNIVSLAYPALILLASRGLRDPLRKPDYEAARARRFVPEVEVVPEKL